MPRETTRPWVDERWTIRARDEILSWIQEHASSRDQDGKSARELKRKLDHIAVAGPLAGVADKLNDLEILEVRGGIYRAFFVFRDRVVVVGALEKKTRGNFKQSQYEQIQRRVLEFADEVAERPRRGKEEG